MQYPIIHVFNADNSVYAKDKGPEFASISQLHRFDNSVIYDANGIRYTVNGVKRIGWKYLLGFHPLMRGRTAKLCYSFSEVKQLNLEEYKYEILDRLNKGVKKGFWYTNKQIPALKESILTSSTFREIINLFLFDLT